MIPSRRIAGTRAVVRKCFGLLRGYVESIAGEQKMQCLRTGFDFIPLVNSLSLKSY
jgi:hypothetical protein